MISSFDPGAMLSQSYELPRGPRVRLRVARPGDAPGLRALWEQQGVEFDELELSRVVRADPRRRLVICAGSLIGFKETIVGLGAIDLEQGGEPDTLVVDNRLTDGLSDLLLAALRGRAAAITQARAA